MLIDALTTARTALSQVNFPLVLSRAGNGALDNAASADLSVGHSTDPTMLAIQLDELLTTRLDTSKELKTRILRTVLTGPTGSGKSTIINTLAGKSVSPTGVLRPTTRLPMAICHADNTDCLVGFNLPSSCQIASSVDISTDAIFFDTPDIDSALRAREANTKSTVDVTATQHLLAAADRWLFVTTAARYADAIPWRALKAASAQGTALAVILNRVPAKATDDIREHMIELLQAQELADIPLFVVCESIIEDGRLQSDSLTGVKEWLVATGLAQEQPTTVDEWPDLVILDPMLHGMGARLNTLADQVESQVNAVQDLAAVAKSAHQETLTRINTDLASGAALRGEALARWQEFVTAGDVLRAFEGRAGRWSGVFGSWLTAGTHKRSEALLRAISNSLFALVTSAVTQGCEEAVVGWRNLPGGSQALASAGVDLSRPIPELHTEVATLIAHWQHDVRQVVLEERRSGRNAVKFPEHSLAATTAIVTVGALAPVTRHSELADSTAVAIVNDHVIQRLADKVREDFIARLTELLAAGENRFCATLTKMFDMQTQATLPTKLRTAGKAVTSATALINVPKQLSVSTVEQVKETVA